jgi:flagellar protein FliT
MECIDHLIELTIRIEKIVDSTGQKVDRDEVLDKLSHLLDEREKLISTFSNYQFSEGDKNRIKQVDVRNQIIIKKMVSIKQLIQKDIMQTKVEKTAFKGYNQVGQSYAIDGSFFDKKK